eukprot:Nk52_evm3s2085 gene=Nk52_evmTU3s2085
MIIRVRSAQGMARIEIADPSVETIGQFLEKVAEKHGLGSSSSSSWHVSTEPNGADPIPDSSSSRAASLSTLKLKNGAIVYLKEMGEAERQKGKGKAKATEGAAGTGGATAMVTDDGDKWGVSGSDSQVIVVEDPVDIEISKVRGLVQRKKDPHFCKHGEQGMCDYCSPMEPYDERYLKEQNLKHMSFHSYVRKLQHSTGKGKFVPLEELNCRVKSNCSGHQPWPEGICSKCQPNAVTLNRQPFRHLDYVEFDTPMTVDTYLQFWRKSGGAQRLGFLYGQHARFTGNEVPLGIKAIVSAIYEPPQECSVNSLQLSDDPNEAIVNEVAAALGLKRVGWIFSDLEDDSTGKGSVFFKRNKDTYFISSGECLMAADFQNANPSPCKLTKAGKYGSKFGTVCVTGDKDGGICLEGYQVSDQGMGLVRDECVMPSKDPRVCRVKESSKEQYVPDVFFSYKNEYGSEVTSSAKPAFPIDFLVVNVGTGTPNNPNPLFTVSSSGQHFPVENREIIGEIQDFGALKKRVSQGERPIDIFSDFHLLTFLASNDFLHLRDKMGPLLEAIRNKDNAGVEAWMATSEWQTVMHIIDDGNDFGAGGSVGGQQHYSGGSTGMDIAGTASASSGGGGGGVTEWACKHCTFINQGSTDACAICSLPHQ